MNVRALFYAAALCSQLLTSCINNIPNEEVPDPGEVPITISTSLKSMTRITENSFEENESIGLYIMVQPATIEKSRYIDNMKFSYNASTGFSPKETVFFPEGNNSCDFISYYPYQANAINKGESGIKVEVKTDQSSKAALSASDFMTATETGITTSENPVDLTFEHKLFRLNILLKAQSGYTLDMLLDANPIVKIKDVYTKATYNLSTDKFTDLNTKADIIPHGDWVIKDDVLCGKSAIIIPQTLSQSHIIIEIYVDDRVFECQQEEERSLTSGIAENSTITLYSSTDATQSTISTSIGSWTYQENDMKANETSTSIQILQLNFTESNVLKVMNKDKQVAEICLEYLCTDQVEDQAIVIYPTTNGKTDLTKGTVLELKSETGEKHGGIVTWNKTHNSLTYTEGTADAVKYIYVTKDGEIKTARPENALQLQLKPDIIIDNRGTETIEYPIVKIGTQYWTRVNLKATKYTDDTDIELGETTVNNNTPQHHIRNTHYYFYNAASIATGYLIPYGWRVGNETDYTQLKAYIKDNASVLKNGASWSNNNFAISNLTSFNAVATGYYNKTYTSNRNTSAYWCANNEKPDVADKIVTLSVNDNKITISSATTDMALTIKCVRN